MNERLSVADVLSHLEAQLARHKEKEAYHGDQEAFHREQKALHAAEHEVVLRHYEAFKATAGAAVEIAARTAVAPEPERPLPPELQPGRRIIRSRLVARVLEELPDGKTFGASELAEEVTGATANTSRNPPTPASPPPSSAASTSTASSTSSERVGLIGRRCIRRWRRSSRRPALPEARCSPFRLNLAFQNSYAPR